MQNLILFALILFAYPLVSWGAVEGQWTYIIENGGATITTSTATGAVTIPSVLGGYTVKKVGLECGRWDKPSFVFVSPNTSVTSITIPPSVTRIENYVFAGCLGLTAFSVDSANIAFTSEDGVLFNKSKTTLIHCSKAKSGSYIIPSSVTSIGSFAFSFCAKLTRVTIPNSVTSIGDKAFPFCTSLTSITIPPSVTSIGTAAFQNCTSLTSVTIPSSVTSIAFYAFSCCSNLTSVTIGDGVKSIEGGAFYRCASLTSVTIPSSVTRIEGSAFGGCDKLPIEILERIKRIRGAKQ